MSIRYKVIFPYLLLTVVVSVIGVYVVTRLVASTIEERLTNQLLEAGRVVSDSFVRQEVRHVQAARAISYTVGLANALAVENRETVLALAEPAFASQGLENVILISPQGRELAHLVLTAEGKVIRVSEDTGAAKSPIVTPFLQSKNPEEAPRRALGLNLVNNQTYYYTALPVSLNGNFSGVIVVGTSLQSILVNLKITALADVAIYYGENGQMVNSTFNLNDQEVLNTLSISPQEYQTSILLQEVVRGNNLKVSGRDFSVARGPLEIGSDRIGVFAVALPLDFVLKSSGDVRARYVILFTLVFFIVVALGVFVARLITTPIFSLVSTSQAIASGQMQERSQVRSNDEIGVLASNFNYMTDRLAESMRELEQKNKILQNLDRTKTNFIQISAHELRTPLTLIMGYSQMLEMDTAGNPALQELARGILDGAERMNDIVDSMLDVSRIDSNTLFLKKSGIQVDLLIRKVRKGFEKALEERNLRMTEEGLEDLPMIPADPDLMQKVFYHLIMNAIKFTPDGGSIHVSGTYLNGSKPPMVQIAVRDTGIGIKPDFHELIFDKFNQTGDALLHSSGKTKFKGGGPGLGLAIAKGIVEAHGGTIRVESPGYNEETFPGSTFFVSLPVGEQLESEA
ncbi:MAG: HAMP domain-containing protein [Chloroflexi bacterium]|nr:HAMP domain-containing protein [Chloroflexota bacterium]